MSYPALVVDALMYAKRRGLSFDDAWNMAMETLPPEDFGFGSATKGGRGVESPMRLFRRHCEAHWYKMGTFKYCDRDGCANFAVVGAFCFGHFIDNCVKREDTT